MPKVTVLTDSEGNIKGVFKKDIDAVRAVPAFRWERGMDGANNTTIYVNTQELLGDHSKTKLGKEFEKHMVQWRAKNESVSTRDKILMMNESLNDVAAPEQVQNTNLLREAKWVPLEGKELAAKEKLADKLVKDFHKALAKAGMALDFYGGDATIVDSKAPGGAEDEGAAYGGLG